MTSDYKARFWLAKRGSAKTSVSLHYLIRILFDEDYKRMKNHVRRWKRRD